jgi:Bax protein
MKIGIRIQMLVFIFASLPFTNVALAEEVFEFDSYKDVMIYFQELGYTEESWDAGKREVNRVYFANMPSRWRGKHSKEVEVRMKKEVFFRVLAPLILRSNELIMQDRVRLQSISEGSEVDAAWLSDLGMRYRVLESIDDPVGPEQIKELIKRVDIVPPSLAMAQTAEESGWGTSRFADQGNAMFGQWAWGENAIKPEQQRAGKGNYGIAAFDNPQDSVNGYMLNINSHRAYASLRDKRAAMRAKGQEPTGKALASTLLNYSERGQHYVDTLNSIMSYNKLAEIDEARLVGPVILLIPVGEGSD